MTVWGQNLTGEKYYQGYNRSVTDDMITAPPREHGVKLGVHI